MTTKPIKHWIFAANGEKYADAVAVANSLLASLRKRLRFSCVGTGRVAHSCCLRNVQMNPVDPTLGPEFYILWANLDADGISVFGFLDQYRKGTITRRYPGWTLRNVVQVAILRYFGGGMFGLEGGSFYCRFAVLNPRCV